MDFLGIEPDTTSKTIAITGSSVKDDFAGKGFLLSIEEHKKERELIDNSNHPTLHSEYATVVPMPELQDPNSAQAFGTSSRGWQCKMSCTMQDFIDQGFSQNFAEVMAANI